ncbi:MAG TPA: hypothetical protein VJR89_32270, partial [Polyangiales bacterium]|nr:hypothetical protein [Polyangiales bacterium]
MLDASHAEVEDLHVVWVGVEGQSVKRFLGEARAANQINHEHIIDITDFGETSDKLVFLVMEYLEGDPLSKLIEAGPV